MPHEVHSSAPTWGIRLIWLVSGVVVLLVALLLPGLITLLLLGALVAYLLDPLVQQIERKGFSRTLSASVVFVVLTLIFLFLIVLLVPAAISQFQELQALDISGAAAAFEAVNIKLNNWFGTLGLGQIDLLDALLAYLGDRVPSFIAILPDALSFLGNLALFPFIVFFLLKDGRRLKKSTLNMVPNRYFEFSLGLLFKMDRQLGNYLRGQLIEALVVGVLSIIVLWALNVPYFLPIGIFAGAANVIPYLGPSAGAITAVSIVLLSGGSPFTAVLIVALFSLIQLLDNAVVQPLVISRNVELHPLLIVISVVAGGQLFGFIGLLLAVPVVAVLKVFLVESVQYGRLYRSSY